MPIDLFARRPPPVQLVVVSLKSGTDIKGILRAFDNASMVLDGASIAGEQQGRTVWRKLIGQVVVPTENIDYWQRHVPVEVLNAMVEEP